MSVRYDVAVVGGGAAGLSAAQTAAAAGKRVVMVSSGELGGECTWNGCVPSKALIEAAGVCHAARNAAQFGIRIPTVDVDFPAVIGHVQDTIARIARYEDAEHLHAAGIEVIRGRATLVSAQRLAVDGAVLECDRVVLCTGSTPAIPPIPGLDGVDFLTNETVFSLTRQPHRLLVIGAGAIGLELAQAFARLGSAVSVIDVAAELLPREDPDVAPVIRDALEAEGVKFALGATIREITQVDGSVRVHLATAGVDQTLEGDALLVATGRRPNVEGLGLDAAGVAVQKTGVVVDQHLRTTLDGVYAAGDVTGVMPFTHVASYQGRLAVSNALGKRRKASYRVVPWAVFTDPEIAHVGLTEPQARREHGDDIRVTQLPYTAIDRAVINRRTKGFIKVITSKKPLLGHAAGGALLGAHVVGANAGELIHEFVVGMQVHAFAGRLAQAVHAYPAMSVGVQQAVGRMFAAGRATGGELREDIDR
jgi:pyruvate/2-oxoglutarate dehydrogenase complex dihydrolipoamide dehydrogenase (E3) component